METSPSENSKNSESLSEEEISAIAAYIFMMNNPELEIKQSRTHASVKKILSETDNK